MPSLIRHVTQFVQPTLHSIPRRLSLLTLLLGVLAACSDSGSQPEPTPTPSNVSAAGGTGQAGVAGAPLANALEILVTDQNGAPLGSVTVTWSATGGGSLSPSSSATGADGVAQSTWTLGPTAGSQTATASVSGLGPVTFTATAEAGPPATVTVTPDVAALESLGETVQLAAAVTDATGNSLSGTFTWSSSDETVATVDANGEVTAVGIGSAQVTAETSGIQGSATVAVEQVPASVTVDPDQTTIVAGNEVQLTATVFDAANNEAPGATVTWSSSDDAVASVDQTGLVSAVAEGSATIMASSGDASGDAAVTVEAAPVNYEPTSDETLSGTVNVADVRIPVGVTITADDDLVLNATGAVEIEGTIEGDCVSIDLNGGSTVNVSGTLDTSCTAPTETSEASISVISEGPYEFDDVTVTSGGAILITNDPTIQAIASANDPSSPAFGFPLPSSQGDGDCRVSGSFTSADGLSGADRVEMGNPGQRGRQVQIMCAGNLDVVGATVEAGDGGAGGHADNSAGNAAGADGSSGGRVLIHSSGDLTFGPFNTFVRSGHGGAGGHGISSDDDASAIGSGGEGGTSGDIQINGHNISTTGSLTLTYGDGGAGGEGRGFGADGDDATETDPAEEGTHGWGSGGPGGNVGNGPTGSVLEIMGTVIHGTRAPGFAVTIDASRAGNGGDALGDGGEGGDGSEDFKNAADGGDATAFAAKGGDIKLTLNGMAPPGMAGVGGVAAWSGSRGGRGARKCQVGMFEEGGAGGEGGDPGGIAGKTGVVGNGGLGPRNTSFITEMGNGGDAGDGIGGGPGGTAGEDDISTDGPQTRQGTNFEDGEDGELCAFLFDIGTSVEDDQNDHNCCTGYDNTADVKIEMVDESTIRITSTDGSFVPLDGTLGSDGSFSAEGTGTVAGFGGVRVTFDGMLTLDADGNPTGIDGQIVVDADNNKLPPNEDDERHNTTYGVTGSINTGS